jgi:hypothetical protein
LGTCCKRDSDALEIALPAHRMMTRRLLLGRLTILPYTIHNTRYQRSWSP